MLLSALQCKRGVVIHISPPSWASLVAQTVKNLPTMREIWVPFLGWEESLEESMVIHASIRAWKSPWTEEPGGLQSIGSQRVGHDWATKHSTSLLTFPPFRLSYPSQASQSTRLGLPVLYSNFSPAVYFTHGSVYISMLLFPFIPLLHIYSIFKCLYIWRYSFT